MRPSLQAFMKRLKGKTVFIIGGGPSANDVDFSLLQDEEVVCVNDAYKFFPNAAGIYWVDETWASQNYDGLFNHPTEFVFTSKPAQHINLSRYPDPTTVANSYILRRTGDAGFDPVPDCVMGNNSGVQVLNLVVNMKPDVIVLIGYDMRKADDGKSHFHDAERPYIAPTIYTDLFIPSISAFNKQRLQYGNTTKIINANPDSAVRFFTFDSYDNYLRSNK